MLHLMSRRSFLLATVGGFALLALPGCESFAGNAVVIYSCAAYCAVFATPFHAPLLQRSMADCHVAMRVALIARGAQAPLLANTAGYALSRCACALTRRLQYG